MIARVIRVRPRKTRPVSEWLDLMLEEIARKKKEEKEAREEAERRPKPEPSDDDDSAEVA